MQNLSLHGGGAQDRLRSPIPPNLPAYFMASLYHHPMSSSLDQYPGASSAGPAQDPMDRALLASRNHREAEKRRRERIKSHLDRLRTVLACDPKIDKASLLAKAVERVRDLKQLTATIPKNQNFPSEHDEIVVLPSISDSSTSSSVPTIFEASVCCDDRADLLPELIETLRGLRMRTLRAEIATLGGRVRSVLLVARERGVDDDRDEDEMPVGNGELLRDALRALVDRQMAATSDRPKRRRMVDMSLA
ncbi:basic helix-loop-helix (bHLH) DNA-binding superfamily protein [Rhynchospora pubera]|uniref:Basic helix-loop-helix (BHLH) DNA-binding superfamily protein n=1 Tax=Rhynchospora pubera TaxID=906938 RepID=A0AAV8FWY4_9POAL|nr:basic helix-loop-helix (bHLH) DNA-binding superfamily protein [Rhynchospora pubera]KAJ4795447.1 basic helix-loop-helix (bHLH) DNA-binding superfamily protein [Rhynchospora pubera]